MADKTEKKREELQKIHSEAIERFALAEQFDREERLLAVEDARFAHSEGGQYDENDTREHNNRPRFTINRVIGVIRQITGDHKQNRSQGKILPDSSDASMKTAKIYSGLIKKIESESSAKNAYDTSFDEKVTSGFGAWRILTQFKEDSFDKEVVIKPINSACTSHYIDPNSTEYTGCDSIFQFLTSFMSKEAFEVAYPDASPINFKQIQQRHNYCGLWFDDQSDVRIAEYWVKTPIMKTIIRLSDNKIVDLKKFESIQDELAEQGITEIKRREYESYKVQMYVMNGVEIIDGPHDFDSKFIPLVPDYGEQYRIENKRYTRGVVRFSKDSNRIYNYIRSTMVEKYALSPKDPYWYTPENVSGFETEYESFPEQNQPFMPYNNDPESPGPPKRTGAPSPDMAGVEITLQSVDDIHATTSMYPPTMGNAPQLLSEKSIRSQAEKGDLGSYTYQDNHEKSLQYSYQILIDLIPRTYDTNQIIQILNMDGDTENIDINIEDLTDFNQTIVDEETGESVLLNDLSLGKYSVTVETGPAFSTQKEESAQQLIELARVSPVFEQLTPDLIAKNLTIVESEEFVKRLRKYAIQQGIADPTEQEIEEMGLNQPQQPDPGEQALQDNVLIQTEKMQSEIELNDAKTQNELVKTQSQTIEALNDLLLAMQKKVDMGIPLTQDDRSLVVQQGDIVEDAQNITQGADNPNSEQAEELTRDQRQGDLDIE